MPYRIDLRHPPADALDRLVTLGALDVEVIDGCLAALMPDGISPEDVGRALGAHPPIVSPAKGRDDGSVWVLSLRPITVGRLLLVPSNLPAPSGSLRLSDGDAFGTGLHMTTALCLEALDEILDASTPKSVLDIGTGSGVLALAALLKGVPQAVGLDIDPDALCVAAENGRLNELAARFDLACGGPNVLAGSWPLVFANILAAPLMAMAFDIVRRVSRGGRLVLSGIPHSVAADVERTYRHLGMRTVGSTSRAGWTSLTMSGTW